MLVLLVLVTPTIVNALGLGKLELQSALNQPFKARVELLSATANELDSLKVSIADQQAFDRANIRRTFLLTQLRFDIQGSEDGPDYIKIRSNESIREPFLNFLLEINWSKGRLFREYTVLLDPPTYTAPGGKRKAVIHPQSPVIEIGPGENNVVYDLDHKSREGQSPPTISYSGSGEYGPAVTGDTLWSIAKAARLDSSVSIQQMMLAILSANPEAFIENNINGLKRGAILQIPDATELDLLGQSDALAQVSRQHALWDEYKGRIVSDVDQQADSVAVTEAQVTEAQVIEEPGDRDAEQEPSVTAVEETGEAELRLISETEQSPGSDQSIADPSGVGADALNNELALANESVEALLLENAELTDRLAETDDIINDLKRLIVLKKDELAAMQEQIRVAAVKQETLEAATASMAEEVVEGDEADAIEEAAAKENVAEEELAVEEEVETDILVSEDEVIEESVAAGDDGTDAISGFMDMGMEILEKAKANLMIIGGAIGGLLLLVFLMIFASKRRSEKATFIELPAEAPSDSGDEEAPLDFDDDEKEDSEAITDVPRSEDETVLPESEDETALPSGDSNDADIDAFEIPQESIVETPLESTMEIPQESAIEIPQESAIEIPQDDPIEEVNVFLAYEHFDEAESFVKKALAEEPDNLVFHSKLLEVFYAAGNKKSYEDAAKVVYEKTNGVGEYWDMAVVMWQEMSPDRVLFEAPTAGEDEGTATETTGGGVLNITDDGSGGSAVDMDFNIGEAETGDVVLEDMLDVTAAADMDSIPDAEEDNNELDFPLGAADALDPSSDDSIDAEEDATSAYDEHTLNASIGQARDDAEDIEEDAAEATEEATASTDADELDIDFGDPGGADIETDLSLDDAIDAEEDATSAYDEHTLNASIGQARDDAEDIEEDAAEATEEATASTDADELDIDFGDPGGADTETDLSLDDAIDTEAATAMADGLDMSFDEPTDDEAVADASVAQASDDADELDIDFGDPGGADTETDLSLDDAIDTEAATAMADGLDMSFDEPTDDEAVSDASVAQASDDADELDIDFGDPGGADTETDLSLDDAIDTEAATAMADGLDMSFDEPTDDEAVADASVAQASDDADELDIDFGDPGGADTETDLSLDDAIDTEAATAMADGLDMSFDEPTDDEAVADASVAQASDDADELDIDFGDLGGADTETDLSLDDAIDTEAATSMADGLDMSFDEPTDDEAVADASVAQASDDADELDIDFGDLGGTDTETDLSLDDAIDTEAATAMADGLDMSFDEPTDDEAVADASVAASDDADELDIDFGDPGGADTETDLSLDEAIDTEAATAMADGLDMSFDEPTDDEAVADASVAQASDDADELDIDFGDPGGADTETAGDLDFNVEDSTDGSASSPADATGSSSGSDDLVDVTSVINFEPEGAEDLLDVTAATDADNIDDVMLGVSDDSNNEGSGVEPDLAEDLEFDLNLSTNGNQSLDNSLDADSEADTDENSVDKESSAQSPAGKNDTMHMSTPDFVMEEDDGDRTYLIAKPINVDEQSKDEEMASQLDLAKAYIELGDNENAKTILDEIIEQGSENYRKQAEELIGQIN